MKLAISTAAISLALASFAGAWSAAIQGYQLPHPAGMDAATEKRVGHVHDFISKKMHFIEGRFINQFTSYTLGGSMDDTASLIWLMREAKAWAIGVTPFDLKNDKIAVRVSLDGRNTITLQVNSGRKDFRKKEFDRFVTTAKRTVRKPLLDVPDASLLFVQSLLRRHEGGAKPEKEARELAAADIKADRLRILGYGMPRAVKGQEIDDSSGLPVIAVAGCCVSKPFVKAVTAYNEAMRKHKAGE